MLRSPPRSTRTVPPFPSATRFRSRSGQGCAGAAAAGSGRRSGPLVVLQESIDHVVDVGGDLSLADRRLHAQHAAHVQRVLQRGHEEFGGKSGIGDAQARSEEHTSELQSLMRTSYAVFCLKKKKNNMRETII